MTDTNGDLPDNRKAAVEAGLAQYNMVAHERDELAREVRELRTQLSGFKVAMEATDARLLDLESRANSMRMERDQAVADRCVYETLFISLQAQMRAFQVPAAPLVKDKSEDQHDALEAMRENYALNAAPANAALRELVNVGRRGVPQQIRSS